MRKRSGPDRKQRRLRRPALSPVLWWAGTSLFALLLLFFNVGVAASEFDVSPVVALVAGFGQSAALVLILIRPTEATALQLLSVAVFAVAIPPGAGPTWPLTALGAIILIAHIGLIAARTDRRTAVTTYWASILVLLLVMLLDPQDRSVSDWLPIMILYPIFAALAPGAVLLTRGWREVRRQLADARRDVEAEQSQRAVAEERTRIARELHDVVAHNMSVIHMQATSASYRLKNLDPETKAEFAQIAAGARSTMREMRQLLAVLRDEGAEAELAPVPGLSRLGELVESAARASVPVEVHDASGTVELPESVALAAYRIIQESLSNVIRHAPGARTRIDLEVEGLDLVLSIVNEAAARPAQPMEAPDRATHGISGMRERARLVGGTLESGARDDGGYQVVARLPIGGYE
ncbi:sensor histidine kinase [Actinoplanes sp. CA-142083]|uniref:sensor histidine kinase n=1 Tax=Actinoplanes sp. CA-142083 TaxID=3239903 RepID=UPI003D89E8F1